MVLVEMNTRKESVRTGPSWARDALKYDLPLSNEVNGVTTMRKRAMAIGHMVVTMRLLMKSKSYTHARLSEGSRSRFSTCGTRNSTYR